MVCSQLMAEVVMILVRENVVSRFSFPPKHTLPLHPRLEEGCGVVFVRWCNGVSSSAEFCVNTKHGISMLCACSTVLMVLFDTICIMYNLLVLCSNACAVKLMRHTERRNIPYNPDCRVRLARLTFIALTTHPRALFCKKTPHFLPTHFLQVLEVVLLLREARRAGRGRDGSEHSSSRSFESCFRLQRSF